MLRRSATLASRLDETLLAALALCFPGVAVLAPLAVVPLTLVAALAALAAEGLSGERLSRPPLPVVLVALALAAWALLSSLWAIDGAGAVETWARLLPTAAAGGFLILHAARQPEARRRRLAGWMLAGFAAAAAILLVEGLSGRAINLFLARLVDQAPDGGGFPLSRLNRGATAVAILAWPAAAALAARLPDRLPWRRRWPVLLLPLGATLLLAFYESGAALLGGAAGLALALAALPAPRLARGLLLVLAALTLLAMPPLAKGLSGLGLADNDGLEFSQRHRVFIWDFTADAIAERPLTGYGFDSSRDLARPGDPRFDATHEALPLHPHNAALQVWLELGAVGLLLGGGLLLLLFARLRGGPPLAAALDLGFGATVLVVGLVAYGVWQYHWLVVPLVAAALLRLMPGPAARAGSAQDRSES